MFHDRTRIREAGAASGAIVAARRDLHVTGVDFAMVPPSRDPQIELISDTPMEYLPFEDESFDAVVSQFGYEYGRTHKTARQLARVLAPDARFSFIVHHAGSTVVATNRARLDAIRTILEALDGCCVAPEELEGWLGPIATVLYDCVHNRPAQTEWRSDRMADRRLARMRRYFIAAGADGFSKKFRINDASRAGFARPKFA